MLAVSSGGGHWVQLLRLAPSLDGCDVTYATVSRAYEADLAGAPLYVFCDATRWNKIRLTFMCLKLVLILFRVRPDVVLSTGAAPGYFAIRLGRLFGARGIWIDSIANAEELSMTGRLVARHADLVLTQWQQLADSIDGRTPTYAGAVV